MIRHWAWALLLVGSCAPTTIVNGFTLDEHDWKRNNAIVRQQAAFDLGCPEYQLILTVLDSAGVDASNVGVRGCDKRVRYLRTRTGEWVRQN
jgi:hypothetical protein